MLEWLYEPMRQAGLSAAHARLAIEGIGIALVLILSWIAQTVSRRVIVGLAQRVASRTSSSWDDILIQRAFFRRLARFAPVFVISAMAPAVVENKTALMWIERGLDLYVLIVGYFVIDAILNAANDLYLTYPISRRVPIRGYMQVVQLLVIIGGAIYAFSLITNRSPLILLSGIGALTAVILLVFKDTILGFVAGIQLVANDMVRPGDWIEMQKYGADGEVTEITLNTVKIRNWDKTITTVPTYALISDSFKNWRGMSESGGRRIKRAVEIDVTSIHFASPDLTDRLRRIQILRPYIDRKLGELAAYNREQNIEPGNPANGRRLTNVGLFRAYLEAYLLQHPKIHNDMTFLVRHLQPTDKGLPIEIYVFSNDQRWAQYEAIQADIFDHIYAVLPEFELRAFQSPSGYDVAAALEALRHDQGQPEQEPVPR